MPGKSRLKVDATSRAKAALTSLQQFFQYEQKIAKLGDQEKAILAYLVRSYPDRGRPAYVEEIQAALKLSDAEAVEQAIRRLSSLDLLVREGSMISCLYPYSVNPTLHEIHFPTKPEWQPVYAACAIDALGVASLIEDQVDVESHCAFCDAPIHIALNGTEILEVKPEAQKIWLSGQPAAAGQSTEEESAGSGECHAATSLCPSIVFACSDQHLAAWRGKTGQMEGYALTFGEALHVAQALFGRVLTAV